MATADALCGVGVPPEVAKRTGWTIVSLTTTATTQNSSGGLVKGDGNKIVLATPHTGDGAITLPSAAGIGDEIIVVNVAAGATNVDLFPHVGGTIHGLAQNGGTPMAQYQSFHAIKLTATLWLGRLVVVPTAT
jgi:hypothetical protein